MPTDTMLPVLKTEIVTDYEGPEYTNVLRILILNRPGTVSLQIRSQEGFAHSDMTTDQAEYLIRALKHAIKESREMVNGSPRDTHRNA